MARTKRKTSFKKPNSLSGLADIVPGPRDYWDYMNRKLHRLARAFGFSMAEGSLLEDASAYEGFELEHGNLVTFADQDSGRIALRPEALPGIMRAYAEHKSGELEKFSKWYYLAQVFGYNEQQKKFVSSWEYGFELFGDFNALAEAHLINLAWKFLKSIGLENLSLEINYVGDPSCRGDYDDALRSFLQSRKYELCNDCAASMETYPMQVFRCKNLGCKAAAAEAPQAIDYLNEASHKRFTSILEGLDELRIIYNLNPALFGKEGTSGTIFSIKYKDEHNEYFIGEGAGHTAIFEQAAGKSVPAFGFVGFMDVLATALKNLQLDVSGAENRIEVFLVPLGDLAIKKSMRLFGELWDAEIAVHDHFGDTGVKNQLKLAEAAKAAIALIIGQKEAMDELVILRDVKSGMQEVFSYDRIIEEVKKRLGK